jgi:inorganic pyrophosphatase
MRSTDFLHKDVFVNIDRPLGSRHPDHGFVYLLNYGSFPGTLAPDGEELDAYVLGVFEPITEFEGRCIALQMRGSRSKPDSRGWWRRGMAKRPQTRRVHDHEDLFQG